MQKLFLCVLLALPGLADEPNLTYTVFGHGGLSGPLANVSDDLFWWIDSGGDATVTGLDAYATGDPSWWPNLPVLSQFFGSSLVSSQFEASAGESLSLGLTLAGAGSCAGYCHDLGFAVLLDDTFAPVALLYMGVPDGDPFLGEGEFGPFLQSSPGVDLSYSARGSLDATIGGTYYSGPPVLTCYAFPCTVDVSTSYTLNAGTYELLFGVEKYRGPSNVPDAALVVDAVNLPEPNTALLLIVMLAGVVGAAWIVRQKGGRHDRLRTTRKCQR